MARGAANRFLFTRDMRHSAVLVRGGELLVFWTRVGDAPERILLSTIALDSDWAKWQASEPVEAMRPELEWGEFSRSRPNGVSLDLTVVLWRCFSCLAEGVELPPEPSVRGEITERAHSLRDPAVLEDEDGRVYLFYCGAGEHCIGVAELLFSEEGPRL